MLIAIYFLLIGAVFFKLFIQLPAKETYSGAEQNLNNGKHSPVILNRDKAAKNNV